MIGLSRLRLALSRNPDAGFPEGDDRYGYLIVAPLNHEGHIDLPTWRAHRARCTVTRLTPDTPAHAQGWLVHREGAWHIHYGQTSDGPDEHFDHLGDHRLFVGDYLTISSPNGAALVYQIIEQVDA
jgi:hypothetical protein